MENDKHLGILQNEMTTVQQWLSMLCLCISVSVWFSCTAIRIHTQSHTNTHTLMYVERFCLAHWTSSWQFSPYSMQMVGVTPR